MKAQASIVFIAWATIGAVAGGLIGYLIEHDFEDLIVGAILGYFAASWLHSRRWLRTSAPKVLGFAAVMIVLGVAGWFGIDAYYDEAGPIWRDGGVQMRPMRSLKGVKLGESFADVSARLGAFELDAPTLIKEEPASARIYVQRGSRIRLRVLGDRVTRVSYECRDFIDETRLNRIGCGAASRRIMEVFGQGARRLCAKEPHAFAFDVLDTGTRYVVLEARVRGIIVMEPEDLEGAVGEQTWHRCQ